MEGVGLAVGVLPELRHYVDSMKGRIDNYRQGPATFRGLSDNLDRLSVRVADMEVCLRAAPDVLPVEISRVLNETYDSARESLRSSNEIMEELSSRAFPGSGSGVMARLRSIFRATALKSRMTAVEEQVKEASNKLLYLISVLADVHLSQRHHKGFFQKYGHPDIVDAADGAYLRNSNTPALPHTVCLDFDAMDGDGQLATPEGKLKHCVLSSDSSKTVTGAIGMISPAFGVFGMAGVGKTIALQGLAGDRDIRNRFPDGRLYLALGQGASLQTVIEEVAKVLRITGANERDIGNVANSGTVASAVDYAVTWLKGKVCLFLVDDVWPNEANSETGYLNELRQLMRESPESRMVISTRSVSIAACAGLKVSFAARDPFGPVSERIFMANAMASTSTAFPEPEGLSLRSNISKILSFCGGLPIALSITGCAVSVFTSIHSSFESACAHYATELETTIRSLADERDHAGKCLSAGILLSLKTLEAKFTKWKERNNPYFGYTLTNLYTSLCVLDCRAELPVSVLGRMWKLEPHSALYIATLFCDMSLCTLSTRDKNGSMEERVLKLHSMQLEFCSERARLKKTTSQWHEELLNGYLTPISPLDALTSAEAFASIEEHILAFVPRPWWSEAVPNDGYIHANLARHLSLANLIIELAALLIDVRWSSLRFHIGGIIALEADFACLKRSGEQWQGIEGDGIALERMTQSFDVTFKTMLHTWKIQSESQRACLLHIYSRYCLKKKNGIAIAFLDSLKKHTSSAYELPGPPRFPEVDNHQKIEKIPTACSPCGRYVAAGAGSNIVIIDARTSSVLRRMKGRKGCVTSVTFVPGSKKLIVGSVNESVILWDWEKHESPSLFLEGRNSEIFCICTSKDGRFIFAGDWHGSLTIWDASTGAQTGKFQQSSGVHALSVCPNGRRIALGLGNGSLKVVNSSNGEKIFEWPEAHKDSAMSIAFCPNGRFLASGSRDNKIRLWDTQIWLTKGDIEECRSWEICVAFGPSEKYVVSASNDCIVRLWSALTGTMVGDLSDLRSITFNSEGNQMIFGSTNAETRVWDALLQYISHDRFLGHGHGVCDVAINRNQVASGSKDRTIRIWDSTTGTQIGTPLRGHKSAVLCVSWSHDGGTLASGSDDCTIRLWDMTTFGQMGDPLAGHTSNVLIVNFSLDDCRVVSGSKDRTVRIWNANTGHQIGVVLEGSATPVRFVSESFDGVHVVSRDVDSKRFIIWRREGGILLWSPANSEDDPKNLITATEANDIVRNCSKEMSHLWPKFFSIHFEHDSVHSSEKERIFGAALRFGTVSLGVSIGEDTD